MRSGVLTPGGQNVSPMRRTLAPGAVSISL
jgi:hypothetical protein